MLLVHTWGYAQSIRVFQCREHSSIDQAYSLRVPGRRIFRTGDRRRNHSPEILPHNYIVSVSTRVSKQNARVSHHTFAGSIALSASIIDCLFIALSQTRTHVLSRIKLRMTELSSTTRTCLPTHHQTSVLSSPNNVPRPIHGGRRLHSACRHP
jgi:hypothetical protein